ncbi:MBL fold metallo-hydrolase [Desulfovibrio inopinatus]|uniref:MBL fold metallo-hydrolase n=1 Tax=Desulfovibrio inopinatus TaxID=102109 RepID=UPI000421E207|nr:MBL fold metallo-hydrolase [Desulfovibrio inopinatus]
MSTLKVVDGVEILTVIDNYIDVFLPDREEVKRYPLWSDGHLNPPLLAEHGLCLLITVHEGGQKHTILVDSGFTSQGCIHNIETLKLPLDQVEAFVLSHGHFDHIGALYNLYESGYVPKGTPLHMHSTALAERGIKIPSSERFTLPQVFQDELEKHGADVRIENGPTRIAHDCCLLTGEVPRRSFEIGFPIGWRNENNEIIRDDIPDDQSLIFHVKGKGLVVVLGCGHSGVINILNYAKELTGCDDIYLVMGGFHLTGELFEKYTEQTIDALAEMHPKLVVPTHCTGFNSTVRFAQRMPEAFVLNSVGTTLQIFAG